MIIYIIAFVFRFVAQMQYPIWMVLPPNLGYSSSITLNKL